MEQKVTTHQTQSRDLVASADALLIRSQQVTEKLDQLIKRAYALCSEADQVFADTVKAEQQSAGDRPLSPSPTMPPLTP